MTTNIATTFPSSRGAAHKACVLIIAEGPRTIEQLFAAIDFGAHGTQKAKIKSAIEAGWIYETPAGTIDVTESTRAHFATQEPKEKFIGEKASPQYRGDWRVGSLSRQHIPDRRGPRADAPAIYSATPTFHRG